MSDFSQYKSYKDKFDSLYIFVINNSTYDELNSKLDNIIKNMDNITDSIKRIFLKSRISKFKEHINENKVNEIIDGIFFVSEKIEIECLNKNHKESLQFFSHPKITYSYGKTYDLEWLSHLITNKEYINVFQIKNNDIKYFILNETKKKYIYQDSIKNIDIKSVINKHIIKNKDEKSDKYFLYGTSSQLKNYQDTNCFQYINTSKILEDEEIINYYKMDKYRKNNEELQDILNKVTHPKFINKIVFGDDIYLELDNSMIEKIYITDNHIDLDKIKEYNANLIFVKSFNNGDDIDIFTKNYNGLLGIKYY